MKGTAGTFLENATFIVGYPKSGTTLLLSLLDGHSDLMVLPKELFFFNRVMGSQDPCAAVLDKTFFKTLHHSSPNLFDAFSKELRAVLAPSLGYKDRLLSVVRAYHDTVKQHAPVQRWVEKTPLNEYFVHLMRAWFGPHLVVIHMVRDPRDNFAAYRAHRATKKRRISIHDFALRWALSVELGERAAREFSGYHMLRYRDLVSDPRGTLAMVASWLTVPLRESMLQPTFVGNKWEGNSTAGNSFSSISDEPLGRHKNILSEKELSYLESVLAPYCERYGYVVSDPSARQWGESALFRAKLAKLIHWHYRNNWTTGMKIPAWLPGVYTVTEQNADKRYRVRELPDW